MANLKRVKLTDILPVQNDFYIRNLRFGEKNSSDSYVLDSNLNIHLAGIDDILSLKKIDWFKNYDDAEDVAALHRFFWLYRIVWEHTGRSNQKLNTQIKEIIYDWIDNVEILDKNIVHSEVWQTYSVVERVVSWVVMLGLTEENADPDKKIINSIIRQLEHIQDHFEYYGDQFTSNHFCNDGRGLYICGAILNHTTFMELGREIIKVMLDRIVPDQRFLREGSSHYQFLVTKWLCDCLWIARECEDIEFEEWITPRLEGMLSGCKFFLIEDGSKWTLPFFGDISPDLSPDWLIGVPWVATYLLNNSFFAKVPNKTGYHSILPDNIQVMEFPKDNIKGNNDWGKMGNDFYMIFSHVNNSLYPNNLTGHFHHDSGSIVVFAGNKPLLIDCGRVNYDVEGLGIWGKNYTGHNLCVIDGNNPEPDMRTFYTDEFIQRYFGSAPKLKTVSNCIEMVIERGRRLKGINKQIRKVMIENSKIIIEDDIRGKGVHNIFLLYHIADIWDVEITEGYVKINAGDNHYQIGTERIEYRVLSRNEKNNFYGVYSDEYGTAKHCTTVLGVVKVSAPIVFKTIIERV